MDHLATASEVTHIPTLASALGVDHNNLRRAVRRLVACGDVVTATGGWADTGQSVWAAGRKEEVQRLRKEELTLDLLARFEELPAEAHCAEERLCSVAGTVVAETIEDAATPTARRAVTAGGTDILLMVLKKQQRKEGWVPYVSQCYAQWHERYQAIGDSTEERLAGVELLAPLSAPNILHSYLHSLVSEANTGHALVYQSEKRPWRFTLTGRVNSSSAFRYSEYCDAFRGVFDEQRISF